MLLSECQKRSLSDAASDHDQMVDWVCRKAIAQRPPGIQRLARQAAGKAASQLAFDQVNDIDPGWLLRIGQHRVVQSQWTPDEWVVNVRQSQHQELAGHDSASDIWTIEPNAIGIASQLDILFHHDATLECAVCIERGVQRIAHQRPFFLGLLVGNALDSLFLLFGATFFLPDLPLVRLFGRSMHRWRLRTSSRFRDR